jgi:hypothetical protein
MAPTESRERLHLGIAFLLLVVQVALRLWWVSSTTGFSTTTFPDESNYYLPAAQAILEQGFSFFLTPRSLWNGPLNPLWIALWHCAIPALKIANLILLSLAGLCLWDWTRKIFGYFSAYVAFLCYIAYPPLFEFGGTLLTEPLFLSLLVYSFWFYFGKPCRNSLSVPAAGISFGLAILVRPTLQLFPLALVVAVVVWHLFLRNRYPIPSREERRLVGFAFISLLVISPVVAKNYFYFGKLGLANGFGAVLYLGNDLRANGDEPLYSELSFNTFEISSPHTHLDSEGDAKLLKAGLQMIAQHPAESALLTVKKAFKFLFGHPDHYFYPWYDVNAYVRAQPLSESSRRIVELFLACFSASFGICGLFLSRLGKEAKLLLTLFVFYMVALHSVAFAIPRLALPLYPVLIFLASGRLITLRSAGGAFASVAFILSAGGILWGGQNWNRSWVDSAYVSYFNERVEVPVENPAAKNDVTEIGSGVFKSAGKDPYIVLNAPEVSAQRNQVVLIELRAEGRSRKQSKKLELQFFWSAGPDVQFSEGNSQMIPIRADGSYRWYRISPSSNLSWSGKLGAFRVDFANGNPGIDYQLRRVVIAR